MAKKKSKKKKLRKILATLKLMIKESRQAREDFLKTIPPQYWNKQQ